LIKLKLPCEGTISSRFGWRLKPKIGWHSGLDIANNKGTEIKSAYNGTVYFIGDRGNYGKTIIIYHKHLGNVWTLYAHLMRMLVSVGDKVKQGTIIGLMDSTGWSTGNHLHWEVRIGKNGIFYAKNPENFINKDG
jgi:murein DD-endopeptidase MepM/ murein hydrolase activator NlpD